MGEIGGFKWRLFKFGRVELHVILMMNRYIKRVELNMKRRKLKCDTCGQIAILRGGIKAWKMGYWKRVIY